MNPKMALSLFALSFASLAQAQTPSLQDLQKEARELTWLSQLSPEDQQKFRDWKTGQAQVQQDLQNLRRKALTAYNDALKNQKSVAEARLLAQKAILDDQLALLPRLEALRNTHQELARKYPRLLGHGHKTMKFVFPRKHIKPHPGQPMNRFRFR